MAFRKAVPFLVPAPSPIGMTDPTLRAAQLRSKAEALQSAAASVLSSVRLRSVCCAQALCFLLVSASAQSVTFPLLRSAQTDKELAHSRLYAKQEGVFAARIARGVQSRIDATAAPGSGNPIVDLHYEPLVLPPGTSLYANQHSLAYAACNADAIIVGMPVSATPMLTPRAILIFTDYSISVGTIVRDDRHRHLSASTNITLTEFGGQARLADGRIATVSSNVSYILALGHTYVLLLQYLPDTQDYSQINESAIIDVTTSGPAGASNVISQIHSLDGAECKSK